MNYYILPMEDYCLCQIYALYWHPNKIRMKNKLSFTIRQEREAEFPAIYELIRTAFATAEVSDGDEQDFANRLRIHGNYIPELALVAEFEGKLIGHIMLTRTVVTLDNGTPYTALMVAPLSVVLNYRNQGVGSALLKEGLRLAGNMGYRVAFLCGNPDYYRRFDFKAIGEYGIRQAGVPEELAPYFMVHELTPGSLATIHGTIDLHA